MGFSRPEYWGGKPFPSPGDLPNPGIKPRSLAWQAESLPAEPPGQPQPQINTKAPLAPSTLLPLALASTNVFADSIEGESSGTSYKCHQAVFRQVSLKGPFLFLNLFFN